MDVRCNRCGTDYEFDDTLISDRGTTVQCTNCGYQFKIYPERTAVTAPERWVVHTMTGKELAYTSLRDLQKAIGEHKVGPKDLLSRGNQPSRPLGAIPELEPFFISTSGPARSSGQSPPKTLHGVAPPPSGAPRPPADTRKQQATQRGFGLPAGTGRGAAMNTTLQGGVTPSGEFSQHSPPSRVLGGIDQVAETERQPEHPSNDPPPVVQINTGNTKMGMGGTQRSGTPVEALQPFVPTPTVRIESTSPPSFDATMPAAPPPGLSPVPAPIASTPLGASPPKSSPRAAPTPEPPPLSTRQRLPSYDELPMVDSVDPARRARSRWIAGVVFLAVAGLLGATLGRQYLVRLSTGRKAEPARRDDRAVRFLTEGTRLLDQAEYDGAQEQLAKAQALSERDPSVLAALARLETVRADMQWLKLRLLDPTMKDIVQATTRELTRRAARARQAVDAAFALSADDPVVLRSRIDAMRIGGEETKAREWIAPVAANASDPQNAYVLAALDLSETAPAFGTVIDRLRAAAVSEHESLRARGALIYALVRAGRVVEAETELAKLSGVEHAHPLTEELKGFVGRFSAPLDGGVDGAAPAASASDAGPEPFGADGKPTGAGPGGDFRSRLTLAAQASARGDLERADALYESVMADQPGNTEALAGLADVARRKGNSARSNSLYERVLELNPSYLPALMAVADQKWGSGDRSGALALYRRILEQAGPSTDYGRRAQSKINEAESSPAAATPTATTPPESPSPTDTADSPRSRPDIDTSDLPGVTPP